MRDGTGRLWPALFAAAVAATYLPLATYAADSDAPVKPEVVEAQPSSSQVDQAGNRQRGNDRPGPATEAIEKAKEASGSAWEATKKGVSNAADYTSEKAGQAWDATKQGTGAAVDWTKQKSERAWDATKETADKAGDAVKKGYEKARQKTKEVLGGD
jgi:hypothetical protein